MVLANFSEFGLIVIAISVSNQWLSADWLGIFAIALSLSFVVAAPLNIHGNQIYRNYQSFWKRFQGDRRLPEDELYDIEESKIAVFGMGRVGTGAYDKMRELYGDVVVGVDFDLSIVNFKRANILF